MPAFEAAGSGSAVQADLVDTELESFHLACRDLCCRFAFALVVASAVKPCTHFEPDVDSVEHSVEQVGEDSSWPASHREIFAGWESHSASVVGTGR